MKKRSIITGGAGFIGSNLTDHLVRIGHKVIVLDNFVSGKRSNLSHHRKKDVKVVNIDISTVNHLLWEKEVLPVKRIPRSEIPTHYNFSQCREEP